MKIVLVYLETMDEGDAVVEVDVMEAVVGMMDMDMEEDILEDMEGAILEDMEEGILAHMEVDILAHTEEDTQDHTEEDTRADMDHPDTRDNMAAAVVEDATEAMACAPTTTAPAPTPSIPNISAVHLALTTASTSSPSLLIRARGE
ncbi:MAG: hypothetical protein L6R36_003578 [Xanthoria steineri]|nr:MAG: hypothetical protein L6R36_003578 [Xanthoria steineri]